uniref:cAMP-dependent protein kinase inhibitor gamma isoform X2 n=1 Tax=Geotrypetes seraphini TaxID=260995 RepID=A0A6P8NJ63_GEOSA|nr:cAMP-dependent protein kinase inhibitor gamma isoform X2 [Geotrypetes seraphini]XP_033770561.1 cAMP-dependent protein kinase inhibitor gamma isoform X2 [Geotrypetes seraphini]XP_033770562.1 cAMP-dependent protein kinase inhibitor gamma isoform X2 [Geotrypetes seraphini]XP_033770563.1 cAMP-dependent protein kinase inhibitor gamma isoform X2 [Geotrypetes seraphini]XP_033770564.1 cAMP-dependent protein kinase inhibitor gamma isoform X2 [Geotrypetes seraphini]XP_033770565.1 cAMP-dependent prote
MEVESAYSDFITCDRAGRRNAVPDIKGDSNSSSVRELAGEMGDLSIQGSESPSDTAASDDKAGERPDGQDSAS